MNEREALDVAAAAVGLAQAAGASEAEVTVSASRRFHVEARETAIARLEQSTGKALRGRVLIDGRKATLSTSDLTRDGLRAEVERCVTMAAHVEPDPAAGLPETFTAERPPLDLYDEAIAARDSDAKVEDVLALERLVRAADARVTNSSGSHYVDAVTVTAIANSAGFGGAYTTTRASRSTAPVALDGDVRRTAHYGTSARHFDELEALESIARTAAARATEMFGARKPPTAQTAVIFERDVAASMLEDIFAALSAANVATANSWLAGRTNAPVGSDLVTILDDGLLPRRLGSSPFDGEGVPTRRTVAIERGVLRSYLYDTYYARKLGAHTTGNSNGAGIGTNNFYLEPGSGSLEELIAATPRGVLVLDTIGFATEHASGTYSRGARGFWIENGERAYPIDECTIAGSFLDILGAVDAVAGDLRPDAAVVSPSFRVGRMTVSGT